MRTQKRILPSRKPFAPENAESFSISKSMPSNYSELILPGYSALILPEIFPSYRKYFTPLSKIFISCSPEIFFATASPRLSEWAIFPYTRPSGLVMPSIAI